MSVIVNMKAPVLRLLSFRKLKESESVCEKRKQFVIGLVSLSLDFVRCELPPNENKRYAMPATRMPKSLEKSPRVTFMLACVSKIFCTSSRISFLEQL